jgi:hypothetical protein
MATGITFGPDNYVAAATSTAQAPSTVLDRVPSAVQDTHARPQIDGRSAGEGGVDELGLIAAGA